jgi:P27 family predicted phage terminase small subunit
MRGRPPKSEAELKKNGSFEKGKHGNRIQLPAIKGIPSPPTDFKGTGNARLRFWWKTYIQDIQSFAQLSKPHLQMVALMCRLMVDREKMDRQIQKDGFTFKTESGQVKINPMVSARNTIDNQLIRTYESFGFSLRSSMTIKTDKPKVGESVLLAAMKGGKTKSA